MSIYIILAADTQGLQNDANILRNILDGYDIIVKVFNLNANKIPEAEVVNAKHFLVSVSYPWLPACFDHHHYTGNDFWDEVSPY